MQIAPWLIVTTTLTAPALPASDGPGLQPVRAAIAAAEPAQQQPQRPIPLATGAPQEPSHRFGLGANITMSNNGGGASMRYWIGDHIGVSFQAAFYRIPTRISSLTREAEYITAVQALPSAMYMLGTADATKLVTLRPYVGIGGHYIRANGIPRSPSPLGQRVNGMGVEAYGGAELSFLDYPDLTISNELMYLRLPESFGTAFSRWNYAVAVHFYLK
jgi:hypothetical protein